MKKLSLFNTSCIILFLTLFNSCKEEEIMVYDESKVTPAVYFTLPYNTAVSVRPTDSLVVKFGFMPVTTTTSIEQVQVTVTGPLHDKDRNFAIKFDDQGTLKEGVHFKVLQESLIIPANKKDGFIKLEISKTADMSKEKLFNTIELIPNESFSTAIKTRKSSLTLLDVPVLKIRLQVDNFIEAPYCWENPPSKLYFDYYVGSYSKAKLDLIIELFDEDIIHFSDPKYAKEGYFEGGTVTFWGNYLKFWLEREAIEGRPHYDENGKAITAGPYAR